MSRTRHEKPVIGIDLGGTNVRAGRVLGNRLLQCQAKKVRSHGTSEEVFEDVCEVIEAVLDPRACGIGIGVPGLVEPKSGRILDTTNIPSWKEVPLKKKLEKKFGLPVRIDNDANCFALGEKYFGAARGREDFVGLIIGTGLGAGIVTHGRLHSGSHCGAGEFGSIPYLDSVVEHYASGHFFLKHGKEGESLSQAAARGDREALQLFEEYGMHLGRAVKIILYAVAPELIVLGGSVSKSYRFFGDALHRELQDFAYLAIAQKLRFKISRLSNSAILGAATLIRNN